VFQVFLVVWLTLPLALVKEYLITHLESRGSANTTKLSQYLLLGELDQVLLPPHQPLLLPGLSFLAVSQGLHPGCVGIHCL